MIGVGSDGDHCFGIEAGAGRRAAARGTGTGAQVVTLNVPAGDYAVSATARGENASTMNPILGACTPFANPGDGIHSYFARAYRGQGRRV